MTSFLDDSEKMNDFHKLSKDEFLTSYSYITEQEYYFTNILDDIIGCGLDIAQDNNANFADVFVGDFHYSMYLDFVDSDIDLTTFVDSVIFELEKDSRVLKVAGVTYDDTLDIIFNF